MQVLQVLQAHHLFACSFSSDSNSLKVIELLATKSLPEDSLYSMVVVYPYNILHTLQLLPPGFRGQAEVVQWTVDHDLNGLGFSIFQWSRVVVHWLVTIVALICLLNQQHLGRLYIL
jgi:hypothetical protein